MVISIAFFRNYTLSSLQSNSIILATTPVYTLFPIIAAVGNLSRFEAIAPLYHFVFFYLVHYFSTQ
jgi:hypothetical protein